MNFNDPKAIQQIKLIGNLNRGKNAQGQDINVNAIMFFIIEEAKETIFDFSQGAVKALWFFFTLIWYQYKMTQYNTLNVKLFNLQLNKLKSRKKTALK